MKKIILILSILLISRTSYGQVITQYDHQIFAAGVDTVSGTPVQTNTYLAAAANCNQVAPAVPTLVVNPTIFFFNDAVNIGKVCILSITAGRLAALPNLVGYLSTITQTDNSGLTSPRSAASNPFNLQAAPNVLTGLKVIR